MTVDICLVSPPQRAYNHYRPPLALALLSSFLKKNEIEVEIVDPISKQPIFGQQKKVIVDQIIRKIDELNPDIVGITCYTPEFNEVISLAKQIKENNKKIQIIIGGVHPTLRPKEFFFKNSPIDFLVIGEGEITLCELTQAVLRNNNFENIAGIAYYDKKKKKITQTKARSLIDNLDAMPFPDYEKLDMEYYTSPNPYAVRGVFLSSFYILVGRGCPSQCTFCVSSKMRKILGPGKSLRCRTAKNVVDEIEFLKKTYLIDSFYFIDDNFTLRKDLVSEICKELIKRRLKLIWCCSARIDTISEELLKQMKKAGCIQVDFGVESGSPSVLKRLKKGIEVGEIKRVFSFCRKVGMRTFANILINVPDETEEDINETIKLLDEIHPTITSFNIFIPFIGTEIYTQYEHKIRLKPREYGLLALPPRELAENPRFRFAKHNIDFNGFYVLNHKKYNSLFNFLPVYFSFNYLTQLIRSKRKKEYFFRFKDLLKEYVKQVCQK